MSKLTKNQKVAYSKVEPDKVYKLSEAAALLKEITFTKFDASVDIDVRLGVDPRKANQMVRGVVTLPHGTGKTVRVLVLCTPEKEAEAKAAGADYVGLDKYVEKIKGGWTDVDVIITTPNVMGKVGALGRILGPRGLMPNPKTGTVTMDVAKAVQDVKAGKIDFKVDKYGIVLDLHMKKIAAFRAFDKRIRPVFPMHQSRLAMRTTGIIISFNDRFMFFSQFRHFIAPYITLFLL